MWIPTSRAIVQITSGAKTNPNLRSNLSAGFGVAGIFSPAAQIVPGSRRPLGGLALIPPGPLLSQDFLSEPFSSLLCPVWQFISQKQRSRGGQKFKACHKRVLLQKGQRTLRGRDSLPLPRPECLRKTEIKPHSEKTERKSH